MQLTTFVLLLLTALFHLAISSDASCSSHDIDSAQSSEDGYLDFDAFEEIFHDDCLGFTEMRTAQPAAGSPDLSYITLHPLFRRHEDADDRDSIPQYRFVDILRRPDEASADELSALLLAAQDLSEPLHITRSDDAKLFLNGLHLTHIFCKGSHSCTKRIVQVRNARVWDELMLDNADNLPPLVLPVPFSFYRLSPSFDSQNLALLLGDGEKGERTLAFLRKRFLFAQLFGIEHLMTLPLASNPSVSLVFGAIGDTSYPSSDRPANFAYYHNEVLLSALKEELSRFNGFSHVLEVMERAAKLHFTFTSSSVNSKDVLEAREARVKHLQACVAIKVPAPFFIEEPGHVFAVVFHGREVRIHNASASLGWQSGVRTFRPILDGPADQDILPERLLSELVGHEKQVGIIDRLSRYYVEVRSNGPRPELLQSAPNCVTLAWKQALDDVVSAMHDRPTFKKMMWLMKIRTAKELSGYADIQGDAIQEMMTIAGHRNKSQARIVKPFLRNQKVVHLEQALLMEMWQRDEAEIKRAVEGDPAWQALHPSGVYRELRVAFGMPMEYRKDLYSSFSGSVTGKLAYLLYSFLAAGANSVQSLLDAFAGFSETDYQELRRFRTHRMPGFSYDSFERTDGFNWLEAALYINSSRVANFEPIFLGLICASYSSPEEVFTRKLRLPNSEWFWAGVRWSRGIADAILMAANHQHTSGGFDLSRSVFTVYTLLTASDRYSNGDNVIKGVHGYFLTVLVANYFDKVAAPYIYYQKYLQLASASPYEALPLPAYPHSNIFSTDMLLDGRIPELKRSTTTSTIMFDDVDGPSVTKAFNSFFQTWSGPGATQWNESRRTLRDSISKLQFTRAVTHI